MNNAPQPTQPADPDLALLFLGSWLATLHDAPERNQAKLDALARYILSERPKTLLGLAITACAEKWLRRLLWMVDFNSLSPSEWGACVVIESAMGIDAAGLPSMVKPFEPDAA
jgi:hypothetical protein